MASSSSLSGLWKEATLPQIVSQLACEKPQSIFGIWPVSPTSYSTGVRTVTYAQLDNIVNGLARYLTKKLKTSHQGQILAYVGPNDIRFPALLLAAIKTGHALFLTSPRNSLVAHKSLFERLECNVLITPDPAPSHVLQIKEVIDNCHNIVIPGIDELMETISPVYVSDKTLDKSRSDPFCVIHTSGSTGIPKPLIWTHETVVRQIEAASCEPPDGLISVDALCRGKRVLSALPPFHGAGLTQWLFNGIPFGNITIVPAAAAGAIITAHDLVNALRHTPADVAILVPSVVAELAQSPDLLEYCAAHLELIVYIGGDLPQATGDIVASKVRLRSQWGASEVGIPPQVFVPELEREEGGWRYVRFHPCIGASFDEITSGTYELVIRREASKANMQPGFSIRGFEDLTEYRTRDLFEPHPTLPDTWRWRARADDIIVFLNGEKTNPISMEQFIVAHNPEIVGGALVIGAQRFQAALVIEPKDLTIDMSIAERANLIESIWPSVLEANKHVPAHAKVEKSLVLITDRRGFIRAGKGTIQRGASLAQYTTEINKLYESAEADFDEDEDQNSAGTSAKSVDLTNTTLVSQLIRNIVRDLTGWTDLEDSTSFLEKGIDSLQALQLSRTLRKNLHLSSLALSTIYQNPSALQLAQALSQATSESTEGTAVADELLSSYRDLILQIPKPARFASSERERGPAVVDVILTGSTGTLGTSILRALLTRKGIGHIFCLNRSADGGRSAQETRFASAGFEVDVLNNGRVTFLQTDLTRSTLGLTQEMYQTLGGRARLIIHNAWPVNFHLPLSAFRAQLAGLVNLLTLATTASPQPMRTVFVSSVSAVAGLEPGPPAESVPSEPVALGATGMNGYARSKLLAELLCETASHSLHIPVQIIRVGQVAGSTGLDTKGAAWNQSEWLPSLVISSLLTLGCLPSDLGPLFSEIDWIPNDLLGVVVADLVVADTQLRASHTSGTEVFNLRNPHTTSWESFVPAIQVQAQSMLARPVALVPPSTWLAKLRESNENNDQSGSPAKSGQESLDVGVVRNPAIKLLSFYADYLWAPVPEGQGNVQPPMVVDQAVSLSPTLRDMPSISHEWMRKWVEEWMDEIKELKVSQP
ncbi:hypothetical protein F5Y03DRAFT_2856 [Xylaria venustula]|nr:hypothetical protein F5Y03DRAFT_2856 [Xylaria venustula]